MTQVNGAPLLLRNDQKLGHHWIRFKLTGTKSNRDAIGAWVNVKVGGKTLSQQVMPTRSYESQSELSLTFGLGANTAVDEVTVVWSGNVTQKIDSVQIDRVNGVSQLK